ncbi:MAG: SoxR reducing system RseC family protein [Muribaculaceae bacterium]|nr:SoxR reducing system RseC family protein [Muribaculaceae bacterium]
MNGKLHFCATVKSVGEGWLEVSADRYGAESCSGCAVSAVCSGGKGMNMRMVVPNVQQYEVGQRVSVSAHEGMRWRAIALCLGFPSALMIIACALAWHFTGSDTVSALSAILVGVAGVGALRFLPHIMRYGGWTVEAVD